MRGLAIAATASLAVLLLVVGGLAAMLLHGE